VSLLHHPCASPSLGDDLGLQAVMDTTASSQAHAIVTGGSSGIGLATACLLARNGVSVTILARNLERLERARSQIAGVAAGRARVAALACDVGVGDACRTAVEQSIAEMGPPTWAVACAGVVRPGTFLALSLDDHMAQLRTNFIGSLNFAHAVVPSMAQHGGGHLVFVASGAALMGIYGYSGYSPSKFAVRGLAEVLRVELREHRIVVTLVHPPDTDTPQLASEISMRPKPTQELAGSAGMWEADQVAAALVRGAKRGKFLVVLGWQLRLLNIFQTVIAPGFRTYQNWVVTRGMRRDG
jgi:3-dehydrosphinganine reductase